MNANEKIVSRSPRKYCENISHDQESGEVICMETPLG